MDTIGPKSRAPWILRWLLVLLLLGGAAGALGIGGLFFYYSTDPELPRIGRITDYTACAL